MVIDFVLCVCVVICITSSDGRTRMGQEVAVKASNLSNSKYTILY